MKRSLVLFLAIVVLLVPVAAQQKIKDLKPTIILVSLDGFRYDYLDKYEAPNLDALAEKGVKASWMIPSFPTKTFPNHYTIATGLYPEHHGIVANNMWDPEFKALFSLGNRDEVQNPRWWQGEPIWVTAQLQGQIAGSFFFPGTETRIKGVQPKYWKPYDGSIPNEERVDTVLSWLDLPVNERPTMLTLYFSDVDSAGHQFSPDSEETGAAVKRVDDVIGRLMEGLKKRKIDEKANVIIVSDHGMIAVPQRRSVVLDDYFDVNDAERVIWVSELVQIWPKKGAENKILSALRTSMPSQIKVYRKSEVPARLNYNDNRRIAPILVMPDAGWIVLNRERADQMRDKGLMDAVRGSHGYDNLTPEMRAIFIAHGPAFKSGYLSDPFNNVEVYNVMCHVLGLKPAPNDGILYNVRDILKK